METMNPPRFGRAALEGDRATITFERRLPHPPEAVWDAITEPEQLALWCMTKATIDGRVGGSIDFLSGPAQLHVTGRILAWDPPRVFEHEWNVEAHDRYPPESSVVRWEILREDYGSLLKMTHSNLSVGASRGFISGLHAFLDRLEASLDGTPMPDWITRVKELRPTYAPSFGTG
jgi:uncharacterized protein YndB with AHSA1/START domain